MRYLLRVFFIGLVLFLLSSCSLFASTPTEAPGTIATSVQLTVQAFSSPTAGSGSKNASPVPPTDAAPTATVVPTKPVKQAQKLEPGNAASLKAVKELKLNSPNKVSWSKDSKFLAVQDSSGVSLYETSDWKLVGSTPVNAPLTTLDFSASTRMFAVSGDANTIILKGITNGGLLRSLAPGWAFGTVSFSPDGQQIAVSSMEKLEVKIFDTGSGSEIKTLDGFETAAPVYGAIFAENGEDLIYISRAKVQIQNIASGSFSPAMEHEDFANAAALSINGKLVVVATNGTVNNNPASFVRLWNPADAKKLADLVAPNPMPAVALSPDGKLAAAGSGTALYLWDTGNHKEVGQPGTHVENIYAIAFSPDGLSLATASSDGAVKIWRVEK